MKIKINTGIEKRTERITREIAREAVRSAGRKAGKTGQEELSAAEIFKAVIVRKLLIRIVITVLFLICFILFFGSRIKARAEVMTGVEMKTAVVSASPSGSGRTVTLSASPASPMRPLFKSALSAGPGISLVIENTAAGDLGDITRTFTYSIYLHNGAAPEDQVYPYTVERSDGTGENGNITNGAGVIAELKHGERIRIYAPAGTEYEAEVTDADDCTTMIVSTDGNGTEDTVTDHGTGLKTIPDAGMTEHFINIRRSPILTGAETGDAAPICLMLLAAGVLLYFLLIHNKKFNSRDHILH